MTDLPAQIYFFIMEYKIICSSQFYYNNIKNL